MRFLSMPLHQESEKRRSEKAEPEKGINSGEAS